MERRLLLVFGLTFIVILLFQPVLRKYFGAPDSKPEAPQAAQTSTQASSPNTPGAPAAVQASPAAKSREAKSPAAAAEVKQGREESETVVENDLYRVTFSNRGGQVKSWVLKKFKKFPEDREGTLDLVNQAAAEKYGYPLSMWLYDEPLRNKVNTALYVASSTGAVSAPAAVTFEYADKDLSVRKTFRFDHSYVIQVETAVTSKGSGVAALPVWPAGFGDETNASAYASSQIEYQANAKTERLAIKKISSGNTLPGPFNWAAVSDRYFAAVFIPDDAQNAAVVTLRNPLDTPKDARNPNNKETVRQEVLGIAAGDLKGATAGRLYVGPKTLEILESVRVPTISGAEPDLRGLVNFGFFGIIARPLFLWLKWTHSHIVANWGWAIVIQTLIINLALLPLRISQMKSMLKMQRVGPQIKAIQEKYKKYSMRDPRKAAMNEEVAALYKKEGVNPAGGCLPLIIQMPFLFAYYSMLGVATDLRHANWLWVHDLSSPDPWHLLPVAIIVTMLFMQRMTPQAGMDPSQQKMMNLMMPVMLGVISWNLAAGLCLYWSEGNLIGIVQQSVMNRTQLGREMREIAEKRARKKEK